MNRFVVVTDSCCDMPIEYMEKNDIPFISLTCSYDGEEYKDDLGKTLTYKKFYQDLKNGSMPKTSQPNAEAYCDLFEKYLEKQLDILYVCVSSVFSGAINSANIAKTMVLDKFPEGRIEIVDALTASLGQGLMVLEAIKKNEAGETIESVVKYLEEYKEKLNTYIIVDDLRHVKRGGRISSTAAMLGIVLHIKPIMTVGHDGHLMPILKIKGRKNAVSKLAEILVERIEKPEEQIIAIGHCDCEEEAIKLKNEILALVKVKDVIINYIGPVVGTHGGPGAMDLFFYGKERQQHIIE